MTVVILLVIVAAGVGATWGAGASFAAVAALVFVALCCEGRRS